MLESLAGHEYYCFLDGYSVYNQIVVAPRIKRRQCSHILMVFFPTEGFHFSCAMPLLLLICIYISASSNNIIKIILLYNYVNSFKALLCCGETELGGKGKA